MLKLLGYDSQEITRLGGIHTAREISQQPKLWLEILESIQSNKKEIQEFISDVVDDIDAIILTGAGTSAYVGMSVEGFFQNNFKKTTLSVPTTHLVTHPADYFPKNKNILLVSFARSGNSPESKAAVTLADHFSKTCHHLIITCNSDGDLAKMPVKNNRYIYHLPEKSNDKSLAMTSSFSGMLLAGLLIADIDHIENHHTAVNQLSDSVENILKNDLNDLKRIAEQDFDRAVFLGSGPLYGIAKEAQLKMQELTDGIVVGKYDSFLGLRHGPKAVINNKTLMCFHFSNDRYVLNYEEDLVNSINSASNPVVQLGISASQSSTVNLDWNINLNLPASEIEEGFLAVASIVPAQILAFFKSINLGLSPDSPSRNGAISRVVQGVNIYEIHNKVEA